jgi:O-antigen ligase
MLYCGTRPLALWFVGNPIEGGSDEEGSVMDRNFLTVLIFVSLVILARRRVDWRVVIKNNGWLIFLLVYAFFSIVWSDYPLVSFKRYVRFVGAFFVGLVILTEINPRETLESVLRRTVYIIVPFSILLIKYFPLLGVAFHRYTGEAMWVGVTIHKNSLGIVCLVAMFLIIWNRFRESRHPKLSEKPKRLPDLLVFAIAAFLMSGQGRFYSASCVAALILGTFVLVGLWWLHRLRTHIGRSLLVIPLVVIFFIGISLPLLGPTAFGGVFEALGRDATLTGRTEIWAELIPKFESQPLLGAGFGSFWMSGTVLGVKEAHSGYLEVLLQLGLTGIFILVSLSFSFCLQCRKALTSKLDWGVFGYCFILMSALHNVANASFLQASDLMWTILILLMIVLSQSSGIRPTVTVTKLRDSANRFG